MGRRRRAGKFLQKCLQFFLTRLTTLFHSFMQLELCFENESCFKNDIIFARQRFLSYRMNLKVFKL